MRHFKPTQDALRPEDRVGQAGSRNWRRSRRISSATVGSLKIDEQQIISPRFAKPVPNAPKWTEAHKHYDAS